MSRWTSADLDRYNQRKAGAVVAAMPAPVKVKVIQAEPEGIAHIKLVLKAMGVEYVTEYRFHPVRRFRFDIAIPDKKIAIEYEGLVATGKKGGHQTKGGYAANCTKYNLAASLGWTVYRYTSRNYKEFKPELIK